MKLCSQCEKENPSRANHCMYCGAELVEEAQLSEEVKLQKKLAEQEEENKLLKAALEEQLKQTTPLELKDIVLPETIEPKPFREKIVYIQPDKKSNEVVRGCLIAFLIAFIIGIVLTIIIIASL
jgi:hypothetical protein